METIREEIRIQNLCAGQSRLLLPPRAARLIMGLAMAASDAFALLLAWALAVGVRAHFLGPLGLADTLWMTVIAALFIIACSVRRLYPAVGVGLVEEFRQLTIITMLIFICSGAIAFLLRESFSRLAFGLMWLFSLGLIAPFRGLVRHLLVKAGVWGEPVVIFGLPEQARRVAAYFNADPKLGFLPQACYSSLEELRRLQNARDLTAQSPNGYVTALVAYEGLCDLAAIREQYREAYERVYMINASDDLDLAGISVREIGTRLAFEIRYTLMEGWAQALKRAIDLLVSILGLIVLAVPLALIALAIYIDSPGRILYRQLRVGKGGRIFSLLKFRTMVLNADQVLREYLDRNPEKKAEWERYQKLRDDPRITRVGRFLRRFSLDELPQIWNVLRGDMSLVGPRPIMVNQQELYGPNIKHYQRVVPGITGMWQISGRNNTSFKRRTEYDVRYVLNWSVWLDIYILVRTIWVVLKRDGAC
jgi:Undecaprenyl-phosphate galactose phosphotransferase WbaP